MRLFGVVRVKHLWRSNSQLQPYTSRAKDGARMRKLSTFQNATRRLNRAFVKPIDMSGMLRTLARLRGSALRGRALGRSIVILAVLMTLSFAAPQKAYSQKPFNVMNIKLYAYNKLTWPQMQCYNELIHHESRWNYKARNGSHYGLGQMRSKWYGTLNPYKQIDAHLRYIDHRYKGCACEALRHWERKGWH
jgi:hypothetical protein